jgi:hypothetical protein
VVAVLAAIALTPSAPVLVPELAGAAAAEVADLSAAARAAAATLPQRWIVVGIGSSARTIEPDTRGTFAGYGVDLPVSLSDHAPARITAMPLCALVAAWLRGQTHPQARAQVRVYPSDLSADAALAHGRELRADIDAIDAPVGVLVVADGAHTLTPAAPGGHDPQSEAVQADLDRALATGDAAALAALPEGIVGRVAYQVLAGLSPHPADATELAHGAPYGVGYFVGTWDPGDRS